LNIKQEEEEEEERNYDFLMFTERG
jgi:hypothetical protein